MPTAILFNEPATGDLEVAALTVLDRLVVAASRAGCNRILVVGGPPQPALKRATALGIQPEYVSETPRFDGPTLFLTTDVLAEAGDLKAVIQQRGRLVSADGIRLPVGYLTPPGGTRLVPVEDRGGLERELAGLPAVSPRGIALPLSDAASARAVEKRLWKSWHSPTDGAIDRYFNRPLGRLISKVLVRTAVTPNQVSIFATLLGLGAAGLFMRGPLAAAIAGALLLQVSAVIDCVDGDIARALFKESSLGKWLDIAGDQVVHVTLFVGLGVGLWRIQSPAPVIPLAISAGIGVLISFAVVLRTMIQPPAKRKSRLQTLIDQATNRDFSVVLLFLTITDQRELFLWLVGIGVHVFWLLALVVSVLPDRSQRASRP